MTIDELITRIKQQCDNATPTQVVLMNAADLSELMERIVTMQTRITELETFDSPVTLVEYAQMKARIEAAAGIAEIPFPDITRSGFPEAFTNGANSMRIEFRKVLGLGGE